MPKGRGKQSKAVETLTHDEARRRNLPSAEHQPLMREEEQSPVRVAYERRNRDLDPAARVAWQGRAGPGRTCVVNAPPLYIQERVHPKALIDDLMRQSRNGHKPDEFQTDMFADFNGLPSEGAKTEFYQHDANWSNRMILGRQLAGDGIARLSGKGCEARCSASTSTRPMASSSTPTSSGLPPAGMYATATASTSPGNRSRSRPSGTPGAMASTPTSHTCATASPSARDLLADSGSIFVQIGDENVHRIRSLMDEVFRRGKLRPSLISFVKDWRHFRQNYLATRCRLRILWFTKEQGLTSKYRQSVRLPKDSC